MEAYDSCLATISEEKQTTEWIHTQFYKYCMGIKRSTEEIHMYAACNKTGTCVSKVPVINGPGKLLFTFKIYFSKLLKTTWLTDPLTRQNELVCKLGFPLFDFEPWKVTGTFGKRVPGRLSRLLLKLKNIHFWLYLQSLPPKSIAKQCLKIPD